MRHLHPVAAHEHFVASGVYVYLNDDQPSGVTESWTVHELPGGAYFTRIDYDSRATDGISVLAEMLEDEQGQIERYNMQLLLHRPRADVQPFKADYTFLDDYVQIGRRVGKADHEYSEVELLPGTLIHLPHYIFLGVMASSLVALGGQAPVFSIDMSGQQNPPGKIGKLIAAEDGHEDITRGSSVTSTRRFLLNRGSQTLWLDDYDIPLRAQYRDQNITVNLTRYAQRP